MAQVVNPSDNSQQLWPDEKRQSRLGGKKSGGGAASHRSSQNVKEATVVRQNVFPDINRSDHSAPGYRRNSAGKNRNRSSSQSLGRSSSRSSSRSVISFHTVCSVSSSHIDRRSSHINRRPSKTRQSHRSRSNLSSRSVSSDKIFSSSAIETLLQKLDKDVRQLSETVNKNYQQSDRRLSRMEVTISKTLVRLGDITRSNAASNHEEPPSNSSRNIPRRMDEGMRGNSGESSRNFLTREQREQRTPDFPIQSLNELNHLNQQLNRDFLNFLVNISAFFTSLFDSNTTLFIG